MCSSCCRAKESPALDHVGVAQLCGVRMAFDVCHNLSKRAVLGLLEVP